MDFDFLKQKRILLVDDEQELLDMVSSIFTDEGFCNLKTAKTVKEALYTSETFQPELAILDVMLPDGNGFDLMKQLKNKSDFPVLFLTARGEDDDKFRGFGLGADDYIVKPFSPSELVARVHAHIARYDRLTAKGEGTADDYISIGNLYIDKNARRVYVNKKEAVLTNKEFDLLVFLASNPNIVFSKNTLFDRIWGFDAIGETSTVTVHINRIREKIEDDSSNPQYIETVWGAGYRFKL